jgi:hypothetical protein
VSSPEVGANVGHLFTSVVNQEQGNIIVKDKEHSSSEALPPFGFNDHQTKVMKDMPSLCYKRIKIHKDKCDEYKSLIHSY